MGKCLLFLIVPHNIALVDPKADVYLSICRPHLLESPFIKANESYGTTVRIVTIRFNLYSLNNGACTIPTH